MTPTVGGNRIPIGRRAKTLGVEAGRNPLGYFGHFSGANAGCADSNALSSAINHGSHTAQIGIPPPPGQVMGMTHPVPVMGSLAADFTHQSHNCTSPR